MSYLHVYSNMRCFSITNAKASNRLRSAAPFKYANVVSFEQWLSLEEVSSERPGKNRVS